MPSVSIILDAELPAESLASVLASVQSQVDVSWELLVCTDDWTTAQRALLDGASHVRSVFSAHTGTERLNDQLRAARGDVIAWLTGGVPWPPTRAREYARALHDGLTGVYMITTGTTADGSDAHRLAALCVEESMVESGFAFRRDLLTTTGLLDVRLEVGRWWDLGLRLLRVSRPYFVAPSAREQERELTLDLVADALADMLCVHTHVADLASELTGVTTRQTALRLQLFQYLTEGLPVLVEALGHEFVATKLCRLTDVVLGYGTDDDRASMRVLLRAADRAAIRDLALHHRRLLLLRAMGLADAVVLACQSGAFPLDTRQLGELVHALRQLGSHEDADRVTQSAPALDLIPLPAPPPRVPAVFPTWLTDTVADDDAWLEAARGYAEVGLRGAALAAASRTTGSLAPDAVAAPDGGADASHDLARLDRHLRAALSNTPWPLAAPVPQAARGDTAADTADAPTGWLEPSGYHLRPGAFGAWLVDVLFQHATGDMALAYLRSQPGPLHVVDSAPAEGYRALALATGHTTATSQLLARHTLHQARLRRTLRHYEARVRVECSALVLDASLATVTAPLVVHAALDLGSPALLALLLRSLRDSRRAFAVLWSGTDVPCLWSHDAVHACLDFARHADLRTTALVRTDEGFMELPLDDAPRADLLLSRSGNDHA